MQKKKAGCGKIKKTQEVRGGAAGGADCLCVLCY